MKFFNAKPIVNGFLGLVFLSGAIFAGGCVTTSDVKSIVVQSNAALISPSIDRPGGIVSDDWQAAVSQIDKLIAENPGEAILVNSLNVRAAMILTVRGQNNLANLRWKDVDESGLQSDRDKLLYKHRDALVWAYANLPSNESFESAKANMHVESLTANIDNAQPYELKILLGTIRAQIALKLINKETDTSDESRDAAKEKLAIALSEYVSLFSSDDRGWVESNQDLADFKGELRLGVFKNRIWMKNLILEYKNEATEQEVTPSWDPGWIVNVN